MPEPDPLSLDDLQAYGAPDENPEALAPPQPDRMTHAAVVLLALGSAAAADVMRQMTPAEVQRLSSRMAAVRAMPRQQVLTVLRDFRDAMTVDATVAFDTQSFLRDVLGATLGHEDAEDVLARLEAAIDTTGLEALQSMSARAVHAILRSEHPQVVATVLVFLQPQHAAEVAGLFDPAMRDEVLLRVALLDRVRPSALRELNEVMGRAAGPPPVQRPGMSGGIGPTASILALLRGGADERVLERIRAHDPALADRIVERMFTFDDLMYLQQRSLRTLLMEVPQDRLVTALKGANPALRDHLLGTMPRRTADIVAEELELRGPVKVQEVEEAQKEVLALGRELQAEGRLTLIREDAGGGYL
jgi:flagellar motor switch protein FliG